MKKLNTPEYSESVLGKIAQSEEFIEDSQERIGFQDKIRRAASVIALRETFESGYRSPNGDLFAVVSKIDDFARAQDELDECRKYNGTNFRNEKIAPLKTIIDFNHAIKDMVDNNPALDFHEVTEFITNIYHQSHQKEFSTLTAEQQTEQISWFHNAVKSALNGMRHELGAEQIIGCLYDVEYKETSVEDELKGVDYFVTIDEKTFGIDIKASQKAAEKRKDKGFSNPKHAIWSQLTNDDFGDKFRVPTKVAESKAADMRQELQSIANNLI